MEACPKGSSIGNANGVLACEGSTLSHEEAKKRADSRFRTLQLEELERVKRENKLGSDKEGNDIESAKSQETDILQLERKKEIIRRAELSAQSEDLGKRYGEQYPYETLNVSASATSKEIRKAYRKLTLLLHPDKNIPSLKHQALQAFRDIVVAYEVVGNPEKELRLMILDLLMKRIVVFRRFGSTNRVERKILVILWEQSGHNIAERKAMGQAAGFGFNLACRILCTMVLPLQTPSAYMEAHCCGAQK